MISKSKIPPRAKDSDWRDSKNITTDKLLFYTFVAAFFGMPLGTTPPIIFGSLAALIWIFSGKAVQLKHICKNTWCWPILFLMILPWIGFLYTPDPAGMGIGYAAKTHYWVYCLVIASIPFEIYLPHRFIHGFLAGLAVNAFVGGLQLMGVLLPKGQGWYSGLGRGYSTLSAYLVLGILTVSFCFRNSEKKKTRFYLALLMAFYFFHLVILNGRTGYLTFLLLSPLMVRNIFNQFNLLKILMICVLLVGMMFLSPIVRNRVALSVDQLNYHLNADSDSAWGREYTEHQDRFYMWHGAVHIFLDHPFVGVGTGGYQTVLRDRGKPEYPLMAHPHNDLLYMAVSYGIIGIFAFFWLFLEIIKNAREQRHTLPGNFVLSAAYVILVSGLFNAQILDARMAFLLAVSAGLQQGFPKFSKSWMSKMI